jgi:ABC-type transporter Mla subunit MlaD
VVAVAHAAAVAAADAEHHDALAAIGGSVAKAAHLLREDRANLHRLRPRSARLTTLRRPPCVSSVHCAATKMGAEPDAVLVAAGSEAARNALRTQTEQAIKLGIFGAPSFVVGDELFWGNDRLEQALGWARKQPEL